MSTIRKFKCQTPTHLLLFFFYSHYSITSHKKRSDKFKTVYYVKSLNTLREINDR